MNFLIGQLVNKIKNTCFAFCLAIPIIVSLGINTAIFANDILRLTINGHSTGIIDIRLNEGETFLQTYRRLGLKPFKAALYPAEQVAAE